MAAISIPPAPRFSAELADQGTTRTLTAAGELDVASAPRLRDAVGAALERPCDVLVVDLSHMTFIDSTGIHAMVDIEARCRRDGVSLRVVPAPDGVHAVFVLCGLAQRLPFVARLREAAV